MSGSEFRRIQINEWNDVRIKIKNTKFIWKKKKKERKKKTLEILKSCFENKISYVLH